MKKADEILFATIDSLPNFDRQQAAKEILALPDSYSWWDSYRGTKMIPLMTKSGQGTRSGSSNEIQGDFSWVEYAPSVITEWFDNYVFPWTGCKSRVMALITQPGIANKEHIDCDPHELNSLQHKFRIVLQGKTNTLYWLTDKGTVFAPDCESAFIMDGGWPHGMINNTDDVKVTLALGAPWNGKDNYNDITILQKRSDFVMPEGIESLFNTNK
jgi:hypothetical protein